MRTREEDIEIANQIIREECIPECRKHFLYEEVTQEVMSDVLKTCKEILQKHEKAGKLSLKMIDVNISPTIGGHLSVWASEADEESGNYAN